MTFDAEDADSCQSGLSAHCIVYSHQGGRIASNDWCGVRLDSFIIDHTIIRDAWRWWLLVAIKDAPFSSSPFFALRPGIKELQTHRKMFRWGLSIRFKIPFECCVFFPWLFVMAWPQADRQAESALWHAATSSKFDLFCWWCWSILLGSSRYVSAPGLSMATAFATLKVSQAIPCVMDLCAGTKRSNNSGQSKLSWQFLAAVMHFDRWHYEEQFALVVW